MFAALALGVGGIWIGLGSLAMVRHSPGGSLAGSSTLGVAALLVAGWLMMAVGIVAWRRRGRRIGAWLTLAGTAWFVAEWNNPGVGSPIVFTAGLAGYAICPVLVAHAALTHASDRAAAPAERVVLGVAYIATAGILGLGPALAFEPARHGCTQCPDNILAIGSNEGLVATLQRLGVRLGVLWPLILAALITWRLVRSTPAARRVRSPVVVPTLCYLGLVAAGYAHALERGFLSNDQRDHDLWLLQAVAVTGVAIGVTVEWARTRRARFAVARTVVEMTESPPPGGLRDALALTLGDPSLRIAYPLDDGRDVDAHGTPTRVTAGAGEATTALVSDGQPIAFIIHRSDLLGDRRLVADTTSAARLALQNERLRAQANAEATELAQSRQRLVAASDGERRRLERDLHDGAQQRLVGLTLNARILRGQLEHDGSAELANRVRTIEDELRLAVSELRQLASGLHPAVLADYGLAAALHALAEQAGERVTLLDVPDRRLPDTIETAIFGVVAGAAKMGAVSVRISQRADDVVADIDAAGVPDSLVALQDRIGALGGALAVGSTADGWRITAVVPCA